MAGLRAFVLILAALLFAASGVARAAPQATVAITCHETAPADHHDKRAPDLAAHCCAGCMPAPAPIPRETAAPARASARLVPPAVARLLGDDPAPELRPPRP